MSALRRVTALALGLAVWLAHGGQVSAQASTALRRFSLAAAADDGGAGRTRLRYAASDARALSKVLAELGGVAPEDAILSLDPSVDELRRALRELEGRVRAESQKGVRTEIVFYYSGHSDEHGLLLGGARLGYAELRGLLDGVPADVRIAILDSCASGALTRLKGGAQRAPFLFDVSTQVRGHAFLTASSEDEAAQESDRIGGSFFTHYLISGLRGAADVSGDRKVTLTEAYRFAFDETLARTGQTRAGAQHPAYDIQLAGTGDLVMTDLRAPSAELRLDKSVEGRLFVRDPRGALVAELYKPSGRSVSLALPAGSYTLELSRGSELFVAELVVPAANVLGSAAFRATPTELATRRGEPEAYEVRTFAAALIPPYSTNPRRRPRRIMNHVDVAVLYDDPDAIEGVQLSLGGAGARRYVDGLQFGLFFNDTGELGGVQLGLAANVARARAEGVQLAGLASWGSTQLIGAQLAFGMNFARELRGAQLGFGANTTTQGVGLQAGGINWAGDFVGLQAGGLNLAGDVRGLQLGLVNVTSGAVHGMQLGVINYASEADVSLGALAITKQGGVHLLLTTSDTAVFNGSLRFDARYNYSFVNVGWHPLGERVHHTYMLGAGLGAKAPLFRELVFLDLDLGFHVVQRIRHWYRGVPNALVQLRATLRIQAHKHLGVLLGPTFNMLVQTEPERAVHPGWPLRTYGATRNDPDFRLSYWPGWLVGVQL